MSKETTKNEPAYVIFSVQARDCGLTRPTRSAFSAAESAPAAVRQTEVAGVGIMIVGLDVANTDDFDLSGWDHPYLIVQRQFEDDGDHDEPAATTEPHSRRGPAWAFLRAFVARPVRFSP